MDDSGQEDAWGKIEFNEGMKEEEEGNAVAWKTAACSRDERIKQQRKTGKSNWEKCVGKRWFVQDLETQLTG